MIPLPAYFFAYGSLESERNLQERVGTDVSHAARGRLNGYVRIFNKPGATHLYANLMRKDDGSVNGAIFKVTNQAQVMLLQKSEQGYSIVDVTDAYDGPLLEEVRGHKLYAFIALPLNKVRQSYINKCTDGLAEENRSLWMDETVWPENCVIDDDVKKPANR